MKVRRWAVDDLAALVTFGVRAQRRLRCSLRPSRRRRHPVDATASAAKHQAAMAEWKSKILPAAKKEGEVIWYSCAQATEAEGTIPRFNKAYPTSR
jgi:hypothetical protein